MDKRRPRRYSQELVDSIADLISKDDYTNLEICNIIGISEATFYIWKSQKLEFYEAVKKAEKDRINLFAATARKSLAKRLTGYDYEETLTVIVEGKDGKPKIKEKRTTTKHVAADVTAVIFTLKNTDPENFKDRQDINHTGIDGITINLPGSAPILLDPVNPRLLEG